MIDWNRKELWFLFSYNNLPYFHLTKVLCCLTVTMHQFWTARLNIQNEKKTQQYAKVDDRRQYLWCRTVGTAVDRGPPCRSKQGWDARGLEGLCWCEVSVQLLAIKKAAIANNSRSVWCIPMQVKRNNIKNGRITDLWKEILEDKEEIRMPTPPNWRSWLPNWRQRVQSCSWRGAN